MNNDQAIMKRVLLRMQTARQMAARAKARYKSEQETARAEIELVLDDLRAEGINPNSEVGRQCIREIAASRLKRQGQHQFSDAEGFPIREGW